MHLLDKLSTKAAELAQNDTAMYLLERGASKTAYAASGVSVVLGLTINDWGVIVGICAAIITTGFNIWFKMKYGRGKRYERKSKETH